MGGREWQPGDVAAVTIIGHEERQMVRYDTGSERGWYGGVGPAFTQGASHHSDEGEARGATIRPLVVIDPEDRERVEDLCRRYVEAYGGKWDGREKPVIDMQAALRSLVTPPKPVEVLEHYPARTDASGVTTSLCGKVWQSCAPFAVTSGRCPECIAIVDAGWIA